MTVNDEIVDAVGGYFQFALGQALVEAARSANQATSRQVRTLARVFERGVAPDERRQAFETIGRKAQQSVVISYGKTVKARKGAAGQTPYRLQARNPRNRRFAGGALRRVIGDTDFFEATADGLAFGNVDRLNKEARHWARLNAGAGGVGRGSRRRFDVTWSNLVVASIGLDMAARPGFTMPKGYWYNRGEGLVSPGANPRGTDEFYPMSTGPLREHRALDRGQGGKGRGTSKRRPGLQRKRATRGIEARNFLDAGVARIARELPSTYERLYENLYRSGVVGPQSQTVTFRTAPRPGRVGSSVRTRRRY